MYEDEVPVQEPRRPIRRWAWAALAVLMVVGGIRLNQYLRDPDSGQLTGIIESDFGLNETRNLFLGAGRIKVGRRDAKGAVSRRIESELRDNGLKSLLPVLTQVQPSTWSLVQQVGFPGPTIDIAGTAKLDPILIQSNLRKAAWSVRSSSNREGAYHIEAISAKNRPVVMDLVRNPLGRYSIFFRMSPKEGTPAMRVDQLAPLYPRVPGGPK